MNVPVGLGAAFLVRALVKDPPTAQKKDVGTIDYIGLSLVALAFGALQIVLDKGQQEDWLDSSFIVFFTCITVISFLFGIYWLRKQERPVINLKLFAIPSFAMPCLMMFFVGFALYSSSTILPMLVQSNFGYNATLSGLVLSPSGIAVLMVMPIAGRLVNAVQAKYMISFGMLMTAIGLWATGLVTPQTDYNTFVCVRILQMVGLPFLFVPASTLAFSKISAENSSNASAIISLMRNMGGSIGIAVVTSLLSYKEQIEQSNLVQHLTNADAGYRSALLNSTRGITDLGVPAAQAQTSAMGQIYQGLLHQASILAYRDAYNLLAMVLLTLAVAALFMPSNTLRKKSAPVASH
jgi:DHA2 family multidrug resistance protein